MTANWGPWEDNEEKAISAFLSSATSAEVSQEREKRKILEQQHLFHVVTRRHQIALHGNDIYSLESTILCRLREKQTQN